MLFKRWKCRQVAIMSGWFTKILDFFMEPLFLPWLWRFARGFGSGEENGQMLGSAYVIKLFQ
jgi:hypothetical protein